MFHPLPDSAGISEELVCEPLFHLDSSGSALLTQAQLSGLEAGAAHGHSLLLVAPTSSGKTMVGLLAAATWLRSGDGLSRQAVYLVTHRALARQKFNELNADGFLRIFDVSPEEVVLATGDQVVDGAGGAVPDPLSAKLIVATYEKYLGLMAAAGHQNDMTNICFVADEIQILGDTHRGRSVEVLLTIIRSAGFGQFVGLSAVLSQKDSEAISQWLGVNLIVEAVREIPLSFELRASDGTHVWSTDNTEIERREASAVETIDVLMELAKNPKENFPVAVFCMTKRRINELVRAWERVCPDAAAELSFDFDEVTASSAVLAKSLPKGFGIHTADLIDTEREVVETWLESDDLPVVFATTTLAQGLNFSFKTVVFDHWARYIYARKVEEPISHSDFHNIAGRAGRLGIQDHGRVIFSAKNAGHQRAAAAYLNSDTPDLGLGHINVADFEAIALQLVSAGLARSKEQLFLFLSDSLTGYLSKDSIRDIEDVWREKLDAIIKQLQNWGFLR